MRARAWAPPSTSASARLRGDNAGGVSASGRRRGFPARQAQQGPSRRSGQLPAVCLRNSSIRAWARADDPISCLRTRQLTQPENHPHSGSRGWPNARVSCHVIARRICTRVSRMDRLSCVRRLPRVNRTSEIPQPLRSLIRHTPNDRYAVGDLHEPSGTYLTEVFSGGLVHFAVARAWGHHGGNQRAP